MKTTIYKILVSGAVMAGASSFAQNPGVPNAVTVAGVTERYVAAFSNEASQMSLVLNEDALVRDVRNQTLHVGDRIAINIYSCVLPKVSCTLYYAIGYSLGAGTVTNEGQVAGMGGGLNLGREANSLTAAGLPHFAYVQVVTPMAAGELWAQLPDRSDAVTGGLAQPVVPTLPVAVQMDPGVGAICLQFPFVGDQQTCVVRLRGKAFDKDIVKLVDQYSYVGDKVAALLRVAGLAFDKRALEICTKYPYVGDALNCAQKISGQAFDPRYVKLCEGYPYVGDSEACILKFSDEVADDLALATCASYPYVGDQVACVRRTSH